jgi:Xaa-Pro aminopeptidase
MHQRFKSIIPTLPQPYCLYTTTVDLLYLTGVSLDGFWLLLGKEGPVIFTVTMLSDQLQSIMPGISMVVNDNMLQALFDYCKKHTITEIGIDTAKITNSFAQRLGSQLKLHDIGNFLFVYRQVKDIEEIQKIRKACSITVAAYEYIKTRIRPGVTEEAIMFKIEEFFAKNRVRPSFTPIIAFGANSAKPHHLSSRQKLAADDTILMDIGCIFEGYCSDLTRTYFFGRISSLKRNIYSLVKKAHDFSIKNVKSGRKASFIDGIARGVIKAGGYADRFIHSTGHGVGIEIHEAPRVSKKDSTVLKPGMVITIEPGIYLNGQFGVRIEDTVLVTQKGSEVLTK